MPEADMKKELDEALARIQMLTGRIERLENQAATSTSLPHTALLSNSFLKRAFAVWGHYFVAGIIIAVPIWIFMLVLIAVIHGLR